MFVEVKPDLEALVDEMITGISERFSSATQYERLGGLGAVLLGVSAVAARNGLSADSQASLGLLFDYRSRLSGHLSSADEIANLLTADEVALLPEGEQELAGRIATAIAL